MKRAHLFSSSLSLAIDHVCHGNRYQRVFLIPQLTLYPWITCHTAQWDAKFATRAIYMINGFWLLPVLTNVKRSFEKLSEYSLTGKHVSVLKIIIFFMIFLVRCDLILIEKLLNSHIVGKSSFSLGNRIFWIRIHNL